MLSEPPNTGHYMTLRTSRNSHSCQIIRLLSCLLMTSMCHIPVPISLSRISGVMVNNITKPDDKQSTQKSCHEDLWHLFRNSFNHLAGANVATVCSTLFWNRQQSTYLKECFMVKNKPQSLPSTVRSKWVSIRRGCEPPCFQVGQRNLHPPQDPFTSWESTRHILYFLGRELFRHSNDYRNARKFETRFHLIWTAFQHITYLNQLSVFYN